MRKSSDMASLLGSRGRSRPRGGFVQGLRSVVDSWLGRSRSRERSRGFELSGWLVAGGLLASFAVGFLVRDRVGGLGLGSSQAGLDAKVNGPAGAQPGFQGELDSKPLAPNCFVVAIYPNIPEADAKAQAKALAEFLRSRNLAKSRPYHFHFESGSMWGVSVYYDGDAEMRATRDALRRLPDDVPDATFVAWRSSSGKEGKEWPKTWAVR